jgi:hypothetical protein
MAAGSNNDFRIAGALGIEEPQDPNQEVLTQGIGFPLRPISGVPTTDSPKIPDGVIAEGIPQQWMGNWQEGLYYPAGAEVRDQNYLCICVAPLTLEKPAPVPEGSPSFSLPSYTPADQSHTGFVRSGNIFTITQGGYVTQLRVWLPEVAPNITYQVVVVRTDIFGNKTSSTTSNFVGLLDNWAVVSTPNALSPVGTKYEIFLDALNSGGSTQFTGGWTYQGSTQSGAPATQSWTVDNQFLNLRVSDLDLDGTDRTSELSGVIANSTITITDIDNPNNFQVYRVNATTDQGTYVQYSVTLTDAEGSIGAGNTTRLDFDVPIAQSTTYSEEVGVWPAGNPSWGTVQGYLELDGVVSSVPNNAYGVDIEFQPATISTDWDIKTISDI